MSAENETIALGSTTAAPRQTADQRRESVLAAATTAFAARGLYGSSTEEIARRAGISQPYLFRLFGSKLNLFSAVLTRVLLATDDRGGTRDGEPQRVLLHALAAADEPAIRAQLLAARAIGRRGVASGDVSPEAIRAIVLRLAAHNTPSGRSPAPAIDPT